MTDFVEKRLQTRHKARTKVRIKDGEKSKTCECINLSSGGVAVRTEDMSLRVTSEVELTFIINLGEVAKLHRRKATVKYVKAGITGFHMVYKAP